MTIRPGISYLLGTHTELVHEMAVKGITRVAGARREFQYRRSPFRHHLYIAFRPARPLRQSKHCGSFQLSSNCSVQDNFRGLVGNSSRASRVMYRSPSLHCDCELCGNSSEHGPHRGGTRAGWLPHVPTVGIPSSSILTADSHRSPRTSEHIAPDEHAWTSGLRR